MSPQTARRPNNIQMKDRIWESPHKRNASSGQTAAQRYLAEARLHQQELNGRRVR